MKIFLFLFITFVVILNPIDTAALKVNSLDAEEFETCTDRQLNIKFSCKENWKLLPIDNAVLIVISSEPAVTLTIAKMDSDIVFLGQLTKMKLQEMGLYQDGFQINRVKFAQRDALEIKAFSKQYPGRRLLDYFFVHNQALHGVLFSVHPKEQWDEQQFLIRQIADSFQFLPEVKPSSDNAI